MYLLFFFDLNQSFSSFLRFLQQLFSHPFLLKFAIFFSQDYSFFLWLDFDWIFIPRLLLLKEIIVLSHSQAMWACRRWFRFKNWPSEVSGRPSSWVLQMRWSQSWNVCQVENWNLALGNPLLGFGSLSVCCSAKSDATDHFSKTGFLLNCLVRL